MDKAEEMEALAAEAARQIRCHIAKYGYALTPEQLAKHKARAEWMECESRKYRQTAIQ